jgi:hypothetical protein
VVLILYSEDHALGSGILITSKGHIIAAQHVISGFMEVLVDVPGLGLSEATVIAADDIADVALLRLEDGRAETPRAKIVPVNVSKALESKIVPICIVGYPLKVTAAGQTLAPKDHLVYTTQTKQGGFLRINGQVVEGFSGGGVFYDGQLLGLTQKNTFLGSVVMPVRHVSSFLRRYNIVPGTADEFEDASQLYDPESVSKKLQNAIANVDRIMTSVRWTAGGTEIRRILNGAPLEITYAAVLPIQRIDGFISGDVIPVFAGSPFASFSASNVPLNFRIYGTLNNEVMRFLGAKEAIDDVIGRYHALDVKVDWTDLEALQITFSVTRTAGDVTGPVSLTVK